MTVSEGIEQEVAARLESVAAAYEMFEIDPDFADTAQFCEEYGYPLEKSGNTIVVASKRGAEEVLRVHRGGYGQAGCE